MPHRAFSARYLERRSIYDRLLPERTDEFHFSESDLETQPLECGCDRRTDVLVAAESRNQVDLR